MNLEINKIVNEHATAISTLSIMATIVLAVCWFKQDLKEDAKEWRVYFKESIENSDKHWREMFTHMNNRIDTIKDSALSSTILGRN